MKSEKQIEDALIQKLKDLKYNYRADICDRETLEQNFRQHFETLNHVHLSDGEFDRLLKHIINEDVFAAAKILRERNTFERDDGTPLHYTLVNIKDWCKNEFEVIHQFRINTQNSHHRYDVLLLINGIPIVQIELKTLQIAPRRAMEQIVKYKNDKGNGYLNSLLCFVQLFVVSNETSTYYFCNNNAKHFSFNTDEGFLPLYQLADRDNKKITHLAEFTENFFTKCTLGEMISRYMVLVASEQKLMVMRPYQIYAVKAIIDCIKENRGNGYIWHTTGSGKTLTSFKASTILKNNSDIEKCLFVVDRKDLDRQTREEFNKFQEGCVEENTNTATLVKRLLSDDYGDKVIVTTIQKLGLALHSDSRYNQGDRFNYQAKLKPLRDKRIVIIFDECHRSQFGENHEAIKSFFSKAQLFGFTGTPIFEKNATYKQINGEEATYKTTDDVFQKKLHSYTITNAIDDQNVLRFHVDYYKFEQEYPPQDEDIKKMSVVKAILSKHETATRSEEFNAIFATASISDAIHYYKMFNICQEEREQKAKTENQRYRRLNIACLFSPPAEGNKDIQQIQEDLAQEKSDNKQNPSQKKKDLEQIIKDYNSLYDTNHNITEFDSYYQDVQQRIKDQQYSNKDYPAKNKIDIVIVVDMLLTGFDSKYLNTLYVDKNLKYHSLIQAFSRTNRILNDTKPYGNIVDFRQQEDAVKDAIALFSGETTGQNAKSIWLVDPAPEVAKEIKEKIKSLKEFMASHDLSFAPQEINNLKGDQARGEFVNCFKEIQRLKIQLDQYTNLSDLDTNPTKEIDDYLPPDTFSAFRGAYLETVHRLKAQQDKINTSENPSTLNQNDIASREEMDFELVLFSSSVIDLDYIMKLIAESIQSDPTQKKMTRKQLLGLLTSNANLMEEKEDLISYLDTLESKTDLNEKEIRSGYLEFKNQKSNAKLQTLSQEYGLSEVSLRGFVNDITDRKFFDAENLTSLMHPLGLGWKERGNKEHALMRELIPHLRKSANGQSIIGLDEYERHIYT